MGPSVSRLLRRTAPLGSALPGASSLDERLVLTVTSHYQFWRKTGKPSQSRLRRDSFPRGGARIPQSAPYGASSPLYKGGSATASLAKGRWIARRARRKDWILNHDLPEDGIPCPRGPWHTPFLPPWTVPEAFPMKKSGNFKLIPWAGSPIM